MGGSPPSAPTVVMPAPTAPTTYQSVVPLESYQQAADYLKRLRQQTDEISRQTYKEVGTPAEVGARQAGRRTLESAAYLSSLPSGDKYLQESTGRTGQFEPIKAAAGEQLTGAQKEYAQALTRVGEVPAPLSTETPEWAKSTIEEGMPGYVRPKSAAELTAEKEEELKQAKLDQQIRKANQPVAKQKKPFSPFARGMTWPSSLRRTK